MSKISLEPNDSGAGTFSIVSPDSNTNRTLNLPDASGILLNTDNNGNLTVAGDIKITGFNSRFNAGIDGSATNPTFVVNDSDTGLFRAGDNSLGFTTGGSEAVRIDSNGNVGIGKSSPNGKLDVDGLSILGGVLVKEFMPGDTGIPVNQRTGGGAAIFMATRNTNDGTATDAAVYLIKFFHSGDNTPQLIHIAGDDFASISQSSNNTLIIDNQVGNDVYSIIGTNLRLD